MFLKSSKKCVLGFTLVELLVVISIIALLLSIMMPSLSKARESAKKVVCLSNMKSTGVVWSLYASDNADVIVPMNINKVQWFDRIAKYLPNKDSSLFRSKWPVRPTQSILMCPSNKATYVGKSEDAYAVNYAINNRSGVQWDNGSIQYFPTKRLNIVCPSEKIIFADASVWPGTSYSGKKYNYTWIWTDPSKYYVGVDYWVGRFHGRDGADFMWADGHSSFENYNKWDTRNERDGTGAGWWCLTKK